MRPGASGGATRERGAEASPGTRRGGGDTGHVTGTEEGKLPGIRSEADNGPSLLCRRRHASSSSSSDSDHSSRKSSKKSKKSEVERLAEIERQRWVLT